MLKITNTNKTNDLSNTIAIYFTANTKLALSALKDMWRSYDVVDAYSFKRLGNLYVGQILTSDVGLLYDIVENHDYELGRRDSIKLNNLIYLEDLVPQYSDEAYARLNAVDAALAC